MDDQPAGASLSPAHLDAESPAGAVRIHADRDSTGIGDRDCGLPGRRKNRSYPVTVAVSGLTAIRKKAA